MENAIVEIGTRLRELRENKGLSVENIAQNIKIPAKILFKIEAGQLDNLPHPVYARSFIKTYGRALGMDPGELDSLLDLVFDIKQEIEPSSVYTPVEEPSFPWKGPLLAIIVACIVIGGAWLLYDKVIRSAEVGALAENIITRGEYLIFGDKQDSSQDIVVEFSPASPSAEEQSHVSVTEDGMENAGSEITSQQEMPLEGTTSPSVMGPASEGIISIKTEKMEQENASLEAISPFGANKPITSTQEPKVTVPEQPEENSNISASLKQEKQQPAAERVDSRHNTVSAPEHGKKQHEVIVSAKTADCWIRATGPGMEKKDLLLRKGQSVTLQYGQEMTLRLGNIFGVTILHDGQEIPYSRDGAPVRTLNFPL